MEKTKREKLREKSKKITARRKKLREKSKKIKPKREKLKKNRNELKNPILEARRIFRIKERKKEGEETENVSQATVMICDHIDTFTGRPSKCYGRAFQITVSSTIDKDSYEAHVRTHKANDKIYELADDPKYREEHSTAIMVKKWVSDHS